MKKTYKEYVENTLVEKYIEGIDLSKTEWQILNADQLKEFLVENYLFTDGDACIFVGNVDEFNPMNNTDIALGMTDIKLASDFVDFHGKNYDKSKYLIGSVDNNIGKKTIVAQIRYKENFQGITYSNQIPYTKIYSAELNSYFEDDELFKNMSNIFVNIVDKNSPIIMDHCDDYANETEINKNIKLFSILKQSAEEQGFSNAVFLNSCYNMEGFKEVVCPNKQLLKTRNI